MRRPTLIGLLAVLGALVLAQPAQAYYVWQNRELVDKITFSGESDACKYGHTPDYSEDHYDQAIPGPARAVKVVSPTAGATLQTQGKSTLSVGTVTSAVVIATTSYDQVVHVTAKGAYPVCVPFKAKWKSEPVELRVKYQLRVYTTSAPVYDCHEEFLRIHKLHAQRTTCFYAVSVARRYLARAGRATRRYLAPYTCVDRVTPGRRDVFCYARGMRHVSFRYGL